MSYKASRIVIGDIANREAYLEEHPRCEICGSTYAVAVHHVYKQGKRYLNENYTIDLPECYFSLCNSCHAIIHTDKKQYDRRLFGQVLNGRLNWKSFEYWNTSKDGRSFDDIICNYLDNLIQ